MKENNRNIYKSNINIKKFIKKCINNFKNDNKYFNVNNNIIKICDLKCYYKGIVLNNVYNMFAIFMRINNNISKISISELQKNKIFNKNFYKVFYMYLLELDKISIKLDKYKYDLSSHCFKEINIKKYIIFNLIKKINILKKELNSICINILLELEMNLWMM